MTHWWTGIPPGGRKIALASMGPCLATRMPVLDMVCTYDGKLAAAPTTKQMSVAMLRGKVNAPQDGKYCPSQDTVVNTVVKSLKTDRHLNLTAVRDGGARKP